MDPNHIQAYILAGGLSSRMGSEKGLVKLRGKAFIEHILDVIKTITPNIVIIANSDSYSHLGYPVISDIIKEKGPLSGIYTGLMHSTCNNNLFISCDVPLINSSLIRFLISNIRTDGHTSIITHNGKTEPLCGIYSRQSAELIRSLLDQNQLSVHQALKQLNTQYLEISNQDFYHTHIFCNVNSPDELKQLEETLA